MGTLLSGKSFIDVRSADGDIGEDDKHDYNDIVGMKRIMIIMVMRMVMTMMMIAMVNRMVMMVTMMSNKNDENMKMTKMVMVPLG